MSKIIILAAGMGKRIAEYSKNTPKQLIKINGQSIIKRLVKQIVKYGKREITVVVGYEKGKIMHELRDYNLKYIENRYYNNDVNIYSLYLALKNNLEPFYLFESDCIFENSCFQKIFSSEYNYKSVWFSMGKFCRGQKGGIIKSNRFNQVVDLQIVKDYDERFKSYKKMVGVLKVGRNQIDKYYKHLIKSCNNNMKQYYHIPWLNNMDELKSYLCDFGDLKVASVNTLEDYLKSKDMFFNETG